MCTSIPMYSFSYLSNYEQAKNNNSIRRGAHAYSIISKYHLVYLILRRWEEQHAEHDNHATGPEELESRVEVRFVVGPVRIDADLCFYEFGTNSVRT